jgi:hypothetical protein
MMEEKSSLLSAFKRLAERARREGLLSAFLACLRKLNIDIRPFYYLKETLSADVPQQFTKAPEGFEVSVFGFDDVLEISKMEERKGYVDEQYVIDKFNNGDTCVGIKFQGKIAGFAWHSVRAMKMYLYSTEMKPNEAYLFDMYTLKQFRGHNLAPVLRYKSYQLLKEAGKDTFYSIVECFNVASLKVKKKLGAQKVFFGVYTRILKQKPRTFILKRYI